jgi:predicted metalloprotease with PDZ domain
LTSFGDRIKAAEQLDADIRAAHLALSRQQNEAARRAAIATEEKELLLRQIDSLGRQLELEAVRRSGCFASLGLKLGQSADSDPVVVLETRSPAKESGVEVGDQLTAVRLTSSHSIQCLADYGVVAADLTPDACAELSLIRRGRQVSVLLRPALVSN